MRAGLKSVAKSPFNMSFSIFHPWNIFVIGSIIVFSGPLAAAAAVTTILSTVTLSLFAGGIFLHAALTSLCQMTFWSLSKGSGAQHSPSYSPRISPTTARAPEGSSTLLKGPARTSNTRLGMGSIGQRNHRNLTSAIVRSSSISSNSSSGSSGSGSGSGGSSRIGARSRSAGAYYGGSYSNHTINTIFGNTVKPDVHRRHSLSPMDQFYRELDENHCNCCHNDGDEDNYGYHWPYHELAARRQGHRFEQLVARTGQLGKLPAISYPVASNSSRRRASVAEISSRVHTASDLLPGSYHGQPISQKRARRSSNNDL